MRKILTLPILLLLSLTAATQNFSLPQLPDTITGKQARTEYLLLHYWDNYDFQNPDIFIDGDAALGYFTLMKDTSRETSDKAIKQTLEKASKSNRIFSLFIDTFRVYLMNPQSLYCDYERYLAVCEFVINNEEINEYAKLNFEYEKTIILTNRVGEKATNFKVFDKNGKAIELKDIESEYLLVLFNNPDCDICMKTKDNLANSEIVNSMIDSGILKVFAVCPYEQYDLWKATSYPEKWLDGYDKNQTINNEKLYFFFESSSIYLLDKDKKVLKKDIRFDLLESYLQDICSFDALKTSK